MMVERMRRPMAHEAMYSNTVKMKSRSAIIGEVGVVTSEYSMLEDICVLCV